MMKLLVLTLAFASIFAEYPTGFGMHTPEKRKELANSENIKFYTFKYTFVNMSDETGEYGYDCNNLNQELPGPLNGIKQGLSLPGINPLIHISGHDAVKFGYGADANFPYFVTAVYFFQTHWEVPLAAVILYSIMITLGPKLIAAPYKPRKTMAIWNFCLSVFSLVGLSQVLPALLFGRDYYSDEPVGMLNGNSFYKNLCTDSAWYGRGSEGVWVLAFILSKIPELVDTLWLVLAKAEVILLHWYHHISVLLFCWHAYAERASLGIHFCCMNYTVHGVMYFYYAMTQWSMKTRAMVKPYAIWITILQITQMVGGIIFVCSAAFYKWALGYECHSTSSTIMAAFIMYSSYFILFFQLFYARYDVIQHYLGGSKKKSKKKKA